MLIKELLESLEKFQKQFGNNITIEVSIDMTDFFDNEEEANKRIFGKVDSLQYSNGSIILLVYDPKSNF